MTWTKSPPTEYGWYWMRGLRGNQIPQVVLVSVGKYRIATGIFNLTEYDPEAEWAGPIDEPEEPMDELTTEYLSRFGT